MSTNDPVSRSALPIPSKPRTGLITYDAKDPDTKYPPIEQLRPPKGAPNVLVILIDDVGFGASSAFGGPCQTPNAEQLAAGGLKYNRFHTTALCSPTRQALLTGRNHHSVGMGGITEIASGSPGYCSVLPNTASPLARTLKLNGYATAQFGKCHEVPVWETSPAGPFDAWPTGGGGFEYFYGFIGGEAHQWYPSLYEGTTPIEVKKTPEEGYHFMEDMTDKAIGWIGQQKALIPDKPFFVYFAPGATHAPHHVPKEWADKYKGKFDAGLGQAARRDLRAPEEAGRHSRRTASSPRATRRFRRGTTMPEALKPVLRRQMEVYAGFLEYTDHHVGRLLDTLKKLEIARRHARLLHHRRQRRVGRGHAERHLQRDDQLQRRRRARDAGVPDGAARQARRAGVLQPLRGGLGARDEHAVPVDQAGRVALGRHAQRHHRALAERDQGARARSARSSTTSSTSRRPSSKRRDSRSRSRSNGVQQKPIEGVSMLYSFNDAKAAERHETQYFEMFGNRGIYHKGWTAVTRHKTPWLLVGEKVPAFDDDVWELYDTSKDWSQANNLAKQMPEKLHELQRLWLIEATRYNVLPLDDRVAERLNPDLAGRPVLIKGNTQILFGGMGRLSENSVVSIKNKSHAVTAEIDVPEVGRRGRDHRAGRQHRRLEPLREGRQAQVLLQPARHPALLRRVGAADSCRRPSGAHGVRLRRRRPRQGRHGDALRRRQEGRRGQGRAPRRR